MTIKEDIIKEIEKLVKKYEDKRDRTNFTPYLMRYNGTINGLNKALNIINEQITKYEQITKTIYCNCGSKDIIFLREDRDLNLKFYYCNKCNITIQESNYD